MGFHTILVPVDFSRASRRSIDVGVELARASRGRLLLLHVEDPSTGARDASEGKRFEGIALDVIRRHPQTATLRMDGDPRTRIVEAAKRENVDLIVMGTHGHGSFDRMLFGSVSSRLLHTSPVPLVTTPASEVPFAISHVLVGTDFSPPSRRARMLAIDVAESCGAKLTLVHVCPFPEKAYDPREGWQFDRMIAEERLRFESELAETKTRWPQSEGAFLHGEPRERLLEVARHRHADLIFLGTHCRTGAKRWLLGSVAERVAHASAVPVLTTTAEDERE